MFEGILAHRKAGPRHFSTSQGEIITVQKCLQWIAGCWNYLKYQKYWQKYFYYYKVFQVTFEYKLCFSSHARSYSTSIISVIIIFNFSAWFSTRLELDWTVQFNYVMCWKSCVNTLWCVGNLVLTLKFHFEANTGISRYTLYSIYAISLYATF